MSKHIILLFIGALLAGGVFAAIDDVRTWTDASGDHRWNNAKNWDPQQVSNTRNVFPAGRDWEVIIEGTDKYYFSFELPEGSGTVTLKGNATAVLQPGTGAFIQISAGRELNVDGPELRTSVADVNTTGFINGTLRVTSGYLNTGSKTAKTFCGNANVVVDGGLFGHETQSGTLTFTNNATLTINGGIAKIYRALFHSPDSPRESIMRVRMTGGTYWNSEDEFAYITSFGSGAHFVNNGGTVIWSQAANKPRTYLSSEPNNLDNKKYGEGETFAELLPTFGSSLILPTASTYSFGALYFATNGNYDVGGTIYVTNNTDVAAGNIYFASKNIALRGGATIYANAYKVSSYMVSSDDLDISRLNLGIGGFRREDGATQGNWQTVNFLDGIVFGAWGGDVPCTEVSAYAERLKIYLDGPVAYDTQDCFEPTTTRTINMDRIYLTDATELKATGGGTVALYPADKWDGEFRTLEVADNTTLAFCTNTTVGLKTMNLKLGENAKLKINMKNGDYVDASATAEFGDGAKIVVTGLPETLDEGMFYPVYFAPAGTDPDLSKIEYEGGDWPIGWYLAKRGSAVYLTDRKEPVYSDSVNKYSWSGGGSDNVYTNLDNWGGKEGHLCNVNGGADIYFNGRKNTDIYNDHPWLQQRHWLFGEDSGPFLFSGNYVRFQYPKAQDDLNAPSIRSNSKFPIAISNRLAVTSGAPLWPAARSQGSISLMGLGCMTGTVANVYVPLVVAGDIRIGGAYTSKYVRVVSDTSNSTATRTTRLTIMPGGLLKVQSQSGDFNERGAGAFAVARGGILDIAGEELLLTSNSTHYVDGTMTVACPLVPQGRQAFRGDGTLTLSGGVSGEGIVRVEGELTLVPGGAWGSDVVLSVKDNVTIAPTADWDFGGAGLDLAHHSALEFATGGHKVTLRRAVSSVSSTMTVSGGGQLVLAEEGTRLNRLSLKDSSTVAIGGGLAAADGWAKVLAVRDDSVPIEFSSETGGVKQRKYVDDTGYTVYCVKGNHGMMLIFR